MPTTSSQTTRTVPIGESLVPEYRSWDEHRETIRPDDEDRRTSMERPRVKIAKDPRVLE